MERAKDFIVLNVLHALQGQLDWKAQDISEFLGLLH